MFRLVTVNRVDKTKSCLDHLFRNNPIVTKNFQLIPSIALSPSHPCPFPPPPRHNHANHLHRFWLMINAQKFDVTRVNFFPIRVEIVICLIFLSRHSVHFHLSATCQTWRHMHSFSVPMPFTVCFNPDHVSTQWLSCILCTWFFTWLQCAISQRFFYYQVFITTINV